MAGCGTGHPGRARCGGAVLLGLLAAAPAHAQDFAPFSTRGLAGSEGLVVRLSRPPAWRRAALEDPLAIAELRGPWEGLTGIVQIGRGRRRADIAALCTPDRARTLLARPAGDEERDARVTDVVARARAGRPAYDIRYERSNAPGRMVVRSVVVCLKDSQLVVSCAGAGDARADARAIEPVCGRVLDSLAIEEE